MFVILSPQALPGRANRSFSLTVSPVLPHPPLQAPQLEPVAAHHPERLQIDDCLMRLGRRGAWGELVADAEAEDGFAIKLFNTHYEWCLQWPVEPELFQPNTRYQLRIRVRVEKTERSGNAFWAGVYDTRRKKGWGQIQPQTSQVQDGYQWYDVATWTPESSQYIWVGPGVFDKDSGQSAIQAVYVDEFELIRVQYGMTRE
jgi:hypothetical protein